MNICASILMHAVRSPLVPVRWPAAGRVLAFCPGNRKALLPRRHFARAFTLVELLVVIAIIVLLVAILIPVLSNARQAAKVAATRGTINNISIALEAYKSDLGEYPRFPSDKKIFVLGVGPDPTSYGYVRLARAIGTSFQMNQNNLAAGAAGRVYGPYFNPTGKNFCAFTSAERFPNPAAVNYSAVTRTEINAANMGYIDAWGQPIFYFPCTKVARGTATTVFGLNNNWGNTATPDSLFFTCNPDNGQAEQQNSNVIYQVNGVNIYSRLVAYTPTGYWNPSLTAGTPWGVSLGPGGTEPGTLPPNPAYKFRARIGQRTPTSPTVAADDVIVGQNTFLLVSAGPDNQYYTGDEIINESAR